MNAIERRQLRENGWEEWSMTFHGEEKKLWPLVKERRLHPMDLCVVSFLQSHMDTATGRIEVRTTDIASELGLKATQLTPSLKRLREERLLTKGLRGTGYYWMLNPAIWHVGGYKAFEKRMAKFQELVNG